MARRKRTALFDAPVPADDVVVRALRLGDVVATRGAAFFKRYGLTVLQYNVLRILYVRDEERVGLAIGEIGGRLLSPAPDVTRLIDRLEKAGLLERVRLAEDRRVVRVRLTDAGHDLVEESFAPLIAHNREMFAGVPERDLKRLADLLQKALDSLV